MYNNSIKCTQHDKPIIKIQNLSKQLLCPDCLKESPEDRIFRIEKARVKITKQYEIDLQELNQLKLKIDKNIKTFISPNMIEAKRSMKISLSQVQKLVNELMEKEVVIANQILSKYIQIQLKKWKGIDGSKFSVECLEFQEQFPDLWEKIRDKKRQIKTSIAQKLKNQVKKYYIKQFNLQ